MLFSTFFTSIQPPWPLVPSSLMLARWELGLLMAWNIFFICTTVFIMGTDKISPLPKTPDWILLQYYCAPNSPFSVPLPPAAPCCGDSHNRTMDVSQDTQFCLSRAASLQLTGPVGWGFSSTRTKQGLQLHLWHRWPTPRARGPATSSGCVCVQTRIHFIQQSETQAEKTQEPGWDPYNCYIGVSLKKAMIHCFGNYQEM